VDGGAEGVQHLHLLQHVLPAGGADDEQLPALQGGVDAWFFPPLITPHGKFASNFFFT